MTVNNTTATLNEPLQIYQHDRGIILRIQVQRYKYTFNKLQEENMVTESGILSARAVVLPPLDKDGNQPKAFEWGRQNVEEDLVIIEIPHTWTDTEIGKYKLQIQLYGSEPEKARVTLPPVEFTVAPTIGHVAEEGVSIPAYANEGFVDNDYVVEAIEDEDVSQLEQGIYDRTYWGPGDIITAEELNKSEKAINYLVKTQKAKAIYYPEVSEDGMLSWTNDLEYDNPEPMNVMGPQGPVGPQGEQGPQGEAGTSIKILGTEPTKETLDARHLATAQLGDSYVVTEDGDVYVFSGEEFVNVGPMQGPKGDKGEKGDKLRYNDLTEADKADLTKGFITCNEQITRIEIRTEYPDPKDEEDNVLYIVVGE